VVDANLRASQAREASGKVFNVATEKRSVNEVLETLKKLTGRTEVNAEYLKRDQATCEIVWPTLNAAKSVLDTLQPWD